MYVCLGKHTYRDKKRYVCMYVCMVQRYIPSKHTQYVCMSGETYIPRKLEVCMVCMSVWGRETYLDKKRYVCMYVCMHGPNVHTSKARVCMFLGDIEESYIPSMYVCPGKHTYLEN